MKATRRFGMCSATLVAAMMIVNSTTTLAEPLVTGDLTIYYDFDNFTNTVIDGSGNGFNGKVQDATRNILDGATGRQQITTTGTITNDKSNPKRGTGAIRFTQPSVGSGDPVFVDLDGGVIKANFPSRLPQTAVTYAAWLNLEPINTTIGGVGNWNSPASIFQGSTGGPGHGNPYFQLEGDGRIRVALRDEYGANIVNSGSDGFIGHPFPNQPDIDSMGAAPMPWPANEWFHVAVTYDKNANSGAGYFAMYYNGNVIRSGPANGMAGPSDLGQWDQRPFDVNGNYFDGLALGTIYDSGGRRFHGMMDEVYIFTRALSSAEIGRLAGVPEPGSLWMLLLGLAVVTAWRRSRCSG